MLIAGILPGLMTCGLYDEVGEFAVRVGVPSKSGVSGGILAVVPGAMTVAVFGPALDPKGNSIGGKHVMGEFARRTGISLFA